MATSIQKELNTGRGLKDDRCLHKGHEREASQGQNGAFKKGKKEMKWIIQIEGDYNYLEDLIEVIRIIGKEDEIRIYKEVEKYFLESKVLEGLSDPKEVSRKANTFLNLLSLMPRFKSEKINEPLKILEIKQISDDGKEEKVYNPNGEPRWFEARLAINGNEKASQLGWKKLYINFSETAKTSEKSTVAQILDSLSTIEKINKSLQEAKNNSEAYKRIIENLNLFLENLLKYSNAFSEDEKIQEILKIQSKMESDILTLKWISLYKIYELIERDLGGNTKLKEKNWISDEQISVFTRNADYYYRHSAKRLFKLQEPPKRKMELSEAKGLINTLITKYLNYRLQESIDTTDMKGAKP